MMEAKKMIEEKKSNEKKASQTTSTCLDDLIPMKDIPQIEDGKHIGEKQVNCDIIKYFGRITILDKYGYSTRIFKE